MSEKKSLHSVCRWTFNAGKGGFVPGDMRPLWNQKNLDSVKMVKLVKEKIKPKIPDHIELGFEFHYDSEVDESNAKDLADAITSSKLYLAMITPGAHSHFA